MTKHFRYIIPAAPSLWVRENDEQWIKEKDVEWEASQGCDEAWKGHKKAMTFAGNRS